MILYEFGCSCGRCFEAVSDDERLMSDEHRTVLQKNLRSLVQNIDPEGDLLNHLRSVGVLDGRDADRIRNQRSADEMNELLLIDILPFKSDAAFAGLVGALKRSGQAHVANILVPSNACEDDVMSDDHRSFLSQNVCHLVNNMEPRYGLLVKMVADRILSDRDVQRIELNSATDAMNESILRILAKKPDSAFLKFMDALRESNQAHVIAIYGHVIDVKIDVVTQDSSEGSDAEEAVSSELRQQISSIEEWKIEAVRRNCVLVTVLCPNKESLERIWELSKDHQLEQAMREPICDILERRGFHLDFIAVNIDPSDYKRVREYFGKNVMSDEHKRLLTEWQVDPRLVVDARLLATLERYAAVEVVERHQLRNEPNANDLRRKLFDLLRRKPDKNFNVIEEAFSYSESNIEMPGVGYAESAQLHTYMLKPPGFISDEEIPFADEYRTVLALADLFSPKGSNIRNLAIDYSNHCNKKTPLGSLDHVFLKRQSSATALISNLHFNDKGRSKGHLLPKKSQKF